MFSSLPCLSPEDPATNASSGFPGVEDVNPLQPNLLGFGSDSTPRFLRQ